MRSVTIFFIFFQLSVRHLACKDLALVQTCALAIMVGAVHHALKVTLVHSHCHGDECNFSLRY